MDDVTVNKWYRFSNLFYIFTSIAHLFQFTPQLMFDSIQIISFSLKIQTLSFFHPIEVQYTLKQTTWGNVFGIDLT